MNIIAVGYDMSPVVEVEYEISSGHRFRTGNHVHIFCDSETSIDQKETLRPSDIMQIFLKQLLVKSLNNIGAKMCVTVYVHTKMFNFNLKADF